MLRALIGEPVVPAQPAGEGDGSEEGGRLGLLGLYRLHRANPNPYLRPAETLHSVQGNICPLIHSFIHCLNWSSSVLILTH